MDPPPEDALAIALCAADAPGDAIDVLAAALYRGSEHWERCQELLALLTEKRPLPRGQREVAVVLSGALAEAYGARGRWIEARAVARNAPPQSPERRERLAELIDCVERAMSRPPPGSDASLGAVRQLVRAGQARAALKAVSEIAMGFGPDDPNGLWLRDVGTALGRMNERYRRRPPPSVRERVVQRLRERDLQGALAEAQNAETMSTGALRAFIEPLTRLVAWANRPPSGSTPLDVEGDAPATLPIEGHGLAEFQLRMGALESAERAYRSLLHDNPSDERARALLLDLVSVLRALGYDLPSPPPRPEPSVQLTLAKASRPELDGPWAAGSPEQLPVSETTDVLDATEEAEQLLSRGRPRDALDVYRLLAVRHPRQRDFQRRIHEIQTLLAQRISPTSEITAEQHVGPAERPTIPSERPGSDES